MKDTKTQIKLKNLGNALKQLGAICEEPLDNKRIVLDASIQRFEFCYELFWKTLKALLEKEGLETTTPKQVLQQAYHIHWLDNEELWLEMLEDRNKTSHVYDEEMALEIYAKIKRYYTEMQCVYTMLQAL
ncbi:HI0074 family nucleotidyltransferase substrate-binding subunit [soil metagenome]